MQPPAIAVSSQPTLRRATPADAAVIASIYNESINTGDTTADTVHKTAADIARVMAGFTEREGYFVLEDVAGVFQEAAGPPPAIVGWGSIRLVSDRPGYVYSAETSVYLRRALMGRGLGSRIKRALIEQCRRWGYHHLVARIYTHNTASMRYNMRFGYELVGVQREICISTDGRWLDVTIMQLLL